MRRLIVLIALVPALSATILAANAPDALGEARRLYNLADYDGAERAAREALRIGTSIDSANVVLGRILLERFRRSADPADLAAAREALRVVNPTQLDARDRVELGLGWAEALFLEDRFGAAGESFEALIESTHVLGTAARERVLDWWATAIDRQAQLKPPTDRSALYQRIIDRMTNELTADPGSIPASYWIAAAARGCGDLDRAWNAALAAWVRAPLTRDRGVTLRGDLDRLMIHAIAPERAARVSRSDSKLALNDMLGEWETFKNAWSR